MSNAFTRAAAALTADTNLGAAIIYQPAAAPRVNCRVVFSRPIGEFGTHVTGALMASISAADVATPERGDVVILGAALYVGGTRLRAGLELTVEKAEAEESMAMFDLTLSIP